MAASLELEVREVRLYEREVRLRLPFRFGVVTLRHCPQAFARVRVATADGREGWGVAAEMLAPKWFDKNPGLSEEDNHDQLRHALATAAALYKDAGRCTPFALWRDSYDEQVRRCAACGDGTLVAHFGPAMLDRAVLDAACRLQGVSIFEAMRANLPGIVWPGLDVEPFLAGIAAPQSLHARHTVGLVDPIREAAERVDDGLPETLAEVIAAYGQRYFKVKVSGDPEADVARLIEIAGVLDGIDGDYALTLDGNEQFAEPAAVHHLLDRLEAEPRLARFMRSTLFIEQPLSRTVALDADISALSARYPVIVDESDDDIETWPRARALGYRSISAKSCKGLYKALINAARCRAWGDGFMSAEDLTTQAGVAVQQDLALAAMVGASHVERNGHHYVDGMAGLPAGEQQAFLAAHPDLYRDDGGTVRLAIRDGRIAVRSLACPGFATAAEPDFAAMKELPDG